MIDNSTKIIYTEIKHELDILFKIAPNNKSLITINKATKHFKNDEEALWIINIWLKNINNSVTKINKTWKNWLTSIIKDILSSIKYN